MCRRIAMSCLFVFLALVVLGAGVLGYLYWDVTREDPRAPGSQASGGSSVGSAAQPGAGQSPQETLERLEEDFHGTRQRGGNTRFDVRITEAEANQLINSLPEVQNSLQQYDVTNLRVGFEPDRLVLSARAPVFADVKARITIRGRVWAENGKLAYETESVSAGSFPAPGPIRNALDRQLEGAVSQLTKNLDGRVTRVTLTDDALQIEGEQAAR